jgi:hypothetical protein
MKFIPMSMMAGVALILGPIAHHAYYTSQFVKILPAVLNSGGGNIEIPTLCYMVADGTGFFLIAVSFAMGVKNSIAEDRAKKEAAKAAKAASSAG